MVCVGLGLALSLGIARAQGIPAGIQPGTPAPPPPRPGQAQKPSAAIPATAPTAQPAPPVPQLPRTEAAASRPAHRARVQFASGLVTIMADNSSLNQILREIGRQTGIKITGGVTDERVYGTYGPSELPLVLATLLDGTGSNMLLAGDEPGKPQELILTPRQGGPTPPSVASGRDDPAEEDLTPQQTPRVSNAQGIPGVSVPAAPTQPQSVPPPQPVAASGARDATGTPTAGTTTDQSPNGVKTPQQIYDQLMKLQQQQPKPPQ